MRKPETNKEFIIRLAGYNNVLKEAFIISAIDSYARQVAESEPMEHGLIDGVAWQQIARDMLATIANRGARESEALSWDSWLARVESILGDSLTIGDTRRAREMYDEGESVEDCAAYYGAYA